MSEPNSRPGFDGRNGAGARAADLMAQERKAAEVARELEAFRQDTNFLEAHRDELTDQHLNQWVAILDGQVLAADADADRVVQLLTERGIVGRAVFQYLTRDELSLIILHP